MKARSTKRTWVKVASATIREEPEREDRIVFDIVVDAYDETERGMSWFYYLQDQMQFPFNATCIKARATSPLRIGETAQVMDMADTDDCMAEIMVLIVQDGDLLAVPLMQMQCVPENASEQTIQAVEDWHYWVARGYQF